jgi:hypothetical protein
MMPITLGLSPVTSSYEERSLFGGEVVRLIVSIACNAANVQKLFGAPDATKSALTCAKTVLIALSATPFNW